MCRGDYRGRLRGPGRPQGFVTVCSSLFLNVSFSKFSHHPYLVQKFLDITVYIL